METEVNSEMAYSFMEYLDGICFPNWVLPWEELLLETDSFWRPVFPPFYSVDLTGLQIIRKQLQDHTHPNK